jgi:perosamine synthetase
MKSYQTRISKPNIPPNVILKIQRILKSGNLASGELVEKLEQSLSRFLNISYCINLSNGTAALHTALKSLEIGPDDEVITSPFTFISSASSILMAGAKPVFADIEERTFLIDPAEIKKRTTKKTKAIIVVDLFGQMADYQKIHSLVKNKGIFIIQDACQALGAKQGQNSIGYLADLTILSFYATKLIAAGEGGALLTNNRRLAQKAKIFSHLGFNPKNPEKIYEIGFNYRMTEIQAAILLSQLPKIEKILKQRVENVQYLNQKLSSIEGIVTPLVEDQNFHTFSQYTIKVKKPYPLTRNQLLKKFIEAKIEAKVYYPLPLHLQPLFDNLGYKKGDLPNAEKAANEVLSLPVHSSVTKEELNKIIDIVKTI